MQITYVTLRTEQNMNKTMENTMSLIVTRVKLNHKICIAINSTKLKQYLIFVALTSFEIHSVTMWMFFCETLQSKKYLIIT